jgi:hypothetical protein
MNPDAVAALMRRCQRGVGGRDALDDAHSIMADCYGTLGSLQAEIARLRGLLAECERTLAMWSDVAPAVSLRADIGKALAP